MKEIKRGEIYYVRNGKDYMHDVGPGRPAIVVSNETMNHNGNRIMVIYTTTKESGYPGRVEVNIKGNTSFAICNNVNTIFKDRLETYIGEIPQEIMKLIDAQIAKGVGLEPIRDESVSALQRALRAEEEAKKYKHMCDYLMDKIMERADD